MEAAPKKKPPFYVGVVVVSPDLKEILLAKRLEDGFWTGPGGGAEEGESPKEAGIREAFEEADLYLDEDWMEELPVRTARDGKPIHAFVVVLPVKQQTGVQNDPDKEVAKWIWHPIDKPLPQMGENRAITFQNALMHIHERKKIAELVEAMQKPTLEALEKSGPEKPVGAVSPDGKYIKTAMGWKRRATLGHKPHSVTLDVEKDGKRYSKTVHGVMATGHQHAIERMKRVVAGMQRNHPTMKVHRLHVSNVSDPNAVEKSFAYGDMMDFYGEQIAEQERQSQARADLRRQFPEPQTSAQERELEDLLDALTGRGQLQKSLSELQEALEKARPALPIGTIRVWAGQKYVKHSDGWIAVSGNHHGKRMGAFGGEATHTDVADEHDEERKAKKEEEAKAKREAEEKEAAAKKKAEEEKAPKPAEKEKKAPKKAEKEYTPPADSPRGEADAAQEGKDKSEYEFARDSEFANKGEDLKGSARHKRNQWKGLEQAERDGNAAELVKRDTLMKEEPVDFLAAAKPENYMGTLAAYLSLKKFPPAPKSKTLTYYDHAADDEIIRKKWKNKSTGEIQRRAPGLTPTGDWEHIGNVTKADQAKELRADYVEAFERMKKRADSLKNEPDLAKVINGMREECKSLIDDLRKKDHYSDLANQLIPYHNNILGARARGNSVAADLYDFSKAAGMSMNDYKQHPEFAENAKNVIEGLGIDKAFGKTKEKGFSAADAYVGHAERKGPEKPELETKAGQEHALIDEMGMRGIQWGNSVTDEERKHHLKQAAMAFDDLSDILGLPKEMCSFNGRLGLAIGARGRGNALAHYEPEKRVINLTRKGGVGSLAHEWGHFFDNVLSEAHDRGKKSFLTNYAETMGRHAGEGMPVVKAMADLVTSPEWKEFGARMRATESYRKMTSGQRDYWSSTVEMFARTFETYIQHKLSEKGRKNTYLAGVTEAGSGSFWPTKEETAKLAPLFDKVFSSFKSSEYLKKALDLLALERTLLMPSA